MHYSFRLAELLGHLPDPRKRPGTIKAIVEYTGLDRHQVAALLKNEMKYVPLKALSRLCDYLIEHGHATAQQLPGALFAIEPESFWELLARRRRLEICLGVRRNVEAENPEVSYVPASDAVLLGELLNGVTTMGGTALLQQRADYEPQSVGEKIPQRESIKQSLVWSPGQAEEAEVKRRAFEVYNTFDGKSGDKALVCLGSNKSNSIVDIVVANAFGCDPFVSQDAVTDAKQRHCPFFIRYRDQDPHPDSCMAGLKLDKSSKHLSPGIYYEDGHGRWVAAGTEDGKHETALAFYIYRESQGRLEMVLAGFSGRATRFLARHLAQHAQEFWPPKYNEQGVQIGAYIVQFSTSEISRDIADILRTDISVTANVKPVPAKSIARRLLHGGHDDSGSD